MFKNFLFAVAGFTLITATAAKADCANASNPFDEVYCDIQVFHQADHQLNVDYSGLYKVLNPAEQSSLKHGEIQWIKDRNEKCTMSQDGFDFVAMDCAVQLTNDRDSFIKNRARECSSTGCIDSAIGKENESQ
jgi:uncharacterized protein YecT (DUF1311 family)